MGPGLIPPPMPPEEARQRVLAVMPMDGWITARAITDAAGVRHFQGYAALKWLREQDQVLYDGHGGWRKAT